MTAVHCNEFRSSEIRESLAARVFICRKKQRFARGLDDLYFPESLDLLARLEAHSLDDSHKSLAGLQLRPPLAPRDSLRSVSKLVCCQAKADISHAAFTSRKKTIDLLQDSCGQLSGYYLLPFTRGFSSARHKS